MSKFTVQLHDKGRCQFRHELAGAEIITDLPQEYGGGGRSFSSTDLVSAALGSCTLTTIDGIFEREGYDPNKIRISITKVLSEIKSTGRFVPDHHVSNDDLSKILDTSDEWIRQRTGIEARYWVKEGDDVGTSDLALKASKISLGRAGWEPIDLDLIVFATEEIGILASVFHADGNYADVLRAGVPAQKSGPIMNAEVLAKQAFFPYMDGRTVFKLAVTLLPKVALEPLEKAGIQQEALDMVGPTRPTCE